MSSIDVTFLLVYVFGQSAFYANGIFVGRGFVPITKREDSFLAFSRYLLLRTVCILVNQRRRITLDCSVAYQ